MSSRSKPSPPQRGMKRWQVYLFSLFTAAFVWAIAYAALAMFIVTLERDRGFPLGSGRDFLIVNEPGYRVSIGQVQDIVSIFPWYFLIVFGCSCLLRLGWDLLTFNDYKQAVPLLEQDIRAARSDLQRRGFKLTA